MQFVPFENVPKSPSRELALHDSVFDRHRDSILTIVSMKVRWRMVSVVHRDDDSEEAAQFRHLGTLARGHMRLDSKKPSRPKTGQPGFTASSDDVARQTRRQSMSISVSFS